MLKLVDTLRIEEPGKNKYHEGNEFVGPVNG